jgi:hypothetical protein
VYSAKDTLFEPVSYWYPGDFEERPLLGVLKEQEDLRDFVDSRGVGHPRVYLDAGPGGFWITVPAGGAQAAVDAAVAAYKPEPAEAEAKPPLEPLVPRLARALAEIPSGATADDIKAAILTELEKEAQA